MAILTRNIKIDHGAIGNGVVNDAGAFDNFNTWALTNQGSNQIILTIPAGTYLFASQVGNSFFWTGGIKDLIIQGAGQGISILTDDGTQPNSPMFWLGAGSVRNDSSHSAQIVSVNAGTTQVQCLTAAQAGRFTVGEWAIISGIDLQGYGGPPNWHLFDYILPDNVNTNTGIITFTTTPLTHSYLSTWPSFNLAGLGGPATIWNLTSDWDVGVEYRDITISQVLGSTCSGRSVKLTRCTFLGNNGAFPTITKSFQMDDCVGTDCTMEVDKLISYMRINNTTLTKLWFQNASVEYAEITRCTLTNIGGSLDGTPKKLVARDNIITKLNIAPPYGRTEDLSFINNIISGVSAVGGVETAPGDVGVNNSYSMSNGLITIPVARVITAAANNGSGLVRLTVPTGGLITGKTYQVSRTDTGTPENRAVTVIDSTHVDLQGSTWSSDVYSTGSIGAVKAALNWGMPYTNIRWLGPFLKIYNITQDTNNIYITTNKTNGFPGIDPLNLHIHPAPRFTASGNTGCDDIVDLNQNSPGKPIFSYTKRIYTGGTEAGKISLRPSPNTPGAPKIWGEVVSIKINVLTAYSGIQSSLTLTAIDIPTIKSDFSTFRYSPLVNLKVAGERVITSSSTIGTQSGDSSLDLPEAVWFEDNAFLGANISHDVSGETSDKWPVVSIEIITNQGITNDFTTSLGLRAHA